jgi:hypothetical protein
MPDQSELHLTGRQRRRLRLARENGFLDAGCPNPDALLQAYGLWCWRLRIPMVWLERQTPHSRYGVVHLEMMTTPHRLNGAGEAALQALSPVRISANEGAWQGIPRKGLAKLGNAVFRAAIRAGNYELSAGQVRTVDLSPVQRLARIA